MLLLHRDRGKGSNINDLYGLGETLTVSAIDMYQAISADIENRSPHRGNGFFSS